MNRDQKRDKFAAAALAGLLASCGPGESYVPKKAASAAFDFAEAMLKESTARERGEATP